MKLDALDSARLGDALGLAGHAIGLSEPNPRVGCVIGTPDGQVIGRGHTQQIGGPHAEVMALRDAAESGLSTRGATAWVSLEPCAHHGRTPPCCDALIAGGIARVVVALEDPFPQVAGEGLRRLRAAGVQVDLAPPESPEAIGARELNIGFITRQLTGRPWVRLKSAASLDGRTALQTGQSQWITGPEARSDGHAWRRRAGAVLTGIGTVLADDPRLDVRDVPTFRQPLRVIVDSSLRLPPASRLLAPPGQALVMTGSSDVDRRRRLEAAGAEVISLPLQQDGRLGLPDVLAVLAERAINELHVEAGPGLSGSLIQGGHVDELLLYLAPMIIGPGRPIADATALADLEQARRWSFQEVRRLGPDLCCRLRSCASP